MDGGLLLSPSPEPQHPTTDPALENRKLKAKKKEILNNDEASTSSSSYSTSKPNSTRRVSRFSHRLRKPTVRLGMTRRSVVERQAEALALGMSTATFASMVFEKKSATGQNTNVADLALIYASAVKESLANVYGHKLGSFAERSFNSTLRILKVINGSEFPHQLDSAYVASQQRIMESGTQICKSFEEPSYSWLPQKEVSPNEELFIFICRHQIWVQMYIPVAMILFVTYLIIRRSSATKQRMSATSYLLFFGIVCGLSGKLCVDTLGGNGKLWLFIWAMLCLLQYATVRFIRWAQTKHYGSVLGTSVSSLD
ncbi:unnamed protein product [Microthlaspi erraticum]|uniref:Uncharacterized protein n=1 Tax=Microthlaspi erraticum TaxID=1685480 RepID=A0A6D2L8D2_9BRAS|nr:unnamed protein product [Microthlaspi erraticum]